MFLCVCVFLLCVSLCMCVCVFICFAGRPEHCLIAAQPSTTVHSKVAPSHLCNAVQYYASTSLSLGTHQ